MTSLRGGLRETLRLGRDLVWGRPSLMDQLARKDARWSTFVAAVEYVNYEQVGGDVVEFGVFSGKSLALLARAQSFDTKGMTRRIVGFDSFEGLPSSGETHPRWAEGACAESHGWHPLLLPGARVTPDVVRSLFDACALEPPLLEVGPFGVTLPRVIPAKYTEVALLHVDCDLYESTREALEGVRPALSDGAVVLFDDWFHFKGNPTRGEARAFGEFLEAHPEWGASHYRAYATFGNSYIVYRK